MTLRRRISIGSPRDRDGGYILLEALATLAISALVIAGLVSLSGSLLKAADRTAARVERLETEPRLIAAVAKDIRASARLRYAGEGDRFIFLGLPDRIVFASEALQPNGLRAPVAVAYQAAKPGTVLRAEAPIPIGTGRLGDLAFAAPRRLPAGAATIRFSYVKRTKSGGEIVSETWDQADALPVAVRIDLVAGPDSRLLSSLRAPLLVTAEPGCADPAKSFCSRAEKPPAGSAQPLAGSDNETNKAP